jgi:serine/threonine-protein kinase HipA
LGKRCKQISNCDDHLRNHGFLLLDGGLVLSPAYDINPNEMSDGLNLNISDNSNALDYELVKSVAKDFRLSARRAEEIIKHVKKEVGKWRELASKYSIPRSEQERMHKAFKV